jgi:hypothetical protein
MKEAKLKILVVVIIISILFGGCAKFTNSSNAEAINFINNFNTSYSTWIWDESFHIDSPVNFLDFKEVYINTGNSKAYDNERAVKAVPEKYEDFIKTLNEECIKVHALFGESKWALDEDFCKQFDVYYYRYFEDLLEHVKLILDFNKEREHKFDAIHLDIEPHTIPDEKRITDEEKNPKLWDRVELRNDLLTSYVRNLEKIKNQIDKHNEENQDDLKLVVDIPWWYINEELIVDGVNVVRKLANIVDEIVVMNYTNKSNEFLNHGKQFLDNTQEYKIPIRMAMEFDPEQTGVSLCIFSEEELKHYINTGLEEFKKYDAFKGLAIHDYKTFINYKNEKLLYE